jgi:hypothetical protein
MLNRSALEFDIIKKIINSKNTILLDLLTEQLSAYLKQFVKQNK